MKKRGHDRSFETLAQSEEIISQMAKTIAKNRAVIARAKRLIDTINLTLQDKRNDRGTR